MCPIFGFAIRKIKQDNSKLFCRNACQCFISTLTSGKTIYSHRQSTLLKYQHLKAHIQRGELPRKSFVISWHNLLISNMRLSILWFPVSFTILFTFSQKKSKQTPCSVDAMSLKHSLLLLRWQRVICFTYFDLYDLRCG